MKTLDIIIPLYHSEATAMELLDKLHDWIEKQAISVSIIFIDDGSTDTTSKIITTEATRLKLSYQLIKLGKNYGQHTATAIGFFHSTADYVITMDDDLQHMPSEINLLIECMQQNGCDLVYAKYNSKKHHLLRNAGTIILKKILLLCGKDYSMVSSFRLMRSHVIDSFKNNKHRVTYIDERLLNGSSKTEICYVKHNKRLTGKSGYSAFKLIKMALSILLLHSSFPLILISRMGLILSFIFFMIGCYYIYEKIVYDVAIGFTSLIVAIFFSTGLILLSLGTIGEYIRKMWVSSQQLDNVIIESHCKG
jgi:glycosyltransferase involved in cell wall biosynthesis